MYCATQVQPAMAYLSALKRKYSHAELGRVLLARAPPGAQLHTQMFPKPPAEAPAAPPPAPLADADAAAAAAHVAAAAAHVAAAAATAAAAHELKQAGKPPAGTPAQPLPLSPPPDTACDIQSHAGRRLCCVQILGCCHDLLYD